MDRTARQVYARQSLISDPGRYAAAFDGLPADVAALRRIAAGLVFHHRAGGDWAANGVTADRIAEVDTRYADLMVGRLLALHPDLAAERPPCARLVGCCRDTALLFVAMARHHGTAARVRAGFAGYVAAGWWTYHLIAEVWDGAAARWRLVDPGLADGYVDPTDGVPSDVLDVDRRRFLTGGAAWRACRGGAADPERFVLDPEFDDPALRSWPVLAHCLSLDLAALNRVELLLWDQFGLPAEPEPDSPPDLDARDHPLLDAVAATTDRPDPDPAELAAWLADGPFRAPGEVLTFSPARHHPVRVALRG